MSDDYSSFERDCFKKSKRREDFKPKNNNSKQVKVYEPKSAQKSFKSQDYADEPDYPPRYEDDTYNDSFKCQKNDTYKSYASKMSSASKPNQGDKNKFKAWKKDTMKANKNNGESQKDKSRKTSIEWVPSSKVTLFFEKPASVNNSNPTPLPPEARHSSGEDSSITSAGRSTNATVDERKSMETFDFTQDRPDPIQALKSLMRNENQNEKKNSKPQTFQQEKNKGEENVNEVDTITFKEDNRRLYDDNHEKDGKYEDLEIQEDNYSDIDTRMEKKLLNNNIELNEDSDLFIQENQVELKTKMEELEALESKERPVWEDLDTNKVLEDVKKFDHLSIFSQDIKSTWRDKPLETSQQKIGQNILQLTQLQEKQEKQEKELKNKRTSEDDEDYFDRIFSLKISDEPRAVIPNLFNWNKSLSEKEIGHNNIMGNIPATSHSFDLEVLSLKDKNHVSLPAFRNCYIQKDNSVESSPKEFKDGPTMSNSHHSSNNVNYSRPIFQSLMSNSDAKIWYYKDLAGALQGPFSSKMMDDWYSKGYLPLDLDITIGNRSGFRKIKDLVEVAGKTHALCEQINHPYTQQNNASKYLIQFSNKEAKNITNQKDNLQNITRENSCPNIHYGIGSHGSISNNFIMPIKSEIINSAAHPEQNYLDKRFSSDFGSFNGTNRNLMAPMVSSCYRSSNQIQAFDTNRFEANSNQLRNLPR